MPFCVALAAQFMSAPAQATTCEFGDATYVKVEKRAGEEKTVLEPANQANGIFLTTDGVRQQFFVDLPNNPPPGYEMGIMDAQTEKSYPTYIPSSDGKGQANHWPRNDETAPDWILIKGLGRFQKNCP